MKILGVTGNMGMGKSTVCAMLHHQGFPVFDADKVVHALQKPDGLAIPLIKKQFPDAVRNEGLDRRVLRAYIEKDQQNLQRLEDIILPLVAQERNRFLHLMQSRGFQWCVLDIPLLFEKRINLICTKTLVVDAPPKIQKIRIIKRGKIPWSQARILIAHQLPNHLKCKWADIVVKTGLNKAHTFFQVQRVAMLMRQNQL